MSAASRMLAELRATGDNMDGLGSVLSGQHEDIQQPSGTSNKAQEWKNMNQSPPRSYLRDRVDMRETTGITSWLQNHESEINASEQRRLDNRLRAQQAFTESRSEVEALRRELNITKSSIGNTSAVTTASNHKAVPTPQSHPSNPHRDSFMSTGMVDTPSRGGGGMDSSEVAFDMGAKELRPPQPIGEVRDVAVLKEALLSRDRTIERLQRQIQHDRSFYNEELLRRRREAEEERSEHNSRVASLRGQLDELARKQNDAFHIAQSPLTDAARRELETKIEELQAIFHSGIESVKSRTAQSLEDHHGRMEERVGDITDAAQRAIAASRDVFRTERVDALGLTQESILNSVSKEQDVLLHDSEANLYNTLHRTLGTKLTASMEDLFRRQLLSHLMPAMETFLTTTLRDRLSSHLENDLDSIYLEKSVSFHDAVDSQVKSAERRATDLAASLIRFDSAAFSKELKFAVDSIESLRSEATTTLQSNRSEHVDFMLRLQRLYDETARQQRLMVKFSDIVDGSRSEASPSPARHAPPTRPVPVTPEVATPQGGTPQSTALPPTALPPTPPQEAIPEADGVAEGAADDEDLDLAL